MAGAKIVVLYPAPRDPDAFERAYREDHAPMVTPVTFPGLVKFVASKITGTADGGAVPFARVAELHFPSLKNLQAAAASEPSERAVAPTPVPRSRAVGHPSSSSRKRKPRPSRLRTRLTRACSRRAGWREAPYRRRPPVNTSKERTFVRARADGPQLMRKSLG